MGLTRITFVCFLVFNFSFGCDLESDCSKALQDGMAEPRGRHRLQLLFPLLLRISTRLATLVPTAVMGLMGIIVFVIFSKKALIVSLFALFLSLSGKYSSKNEEIYIHKVNSYPEYNDEEHIHHHHHRPPKYKKYWHGKKWKKRVDSIRPNAPNPIPLHGSHFHSGFDKVMDLMEGNSAPALYPSVPDDTFGAEEWI